MEIKQNSAARFMLLSLVMLVMGSFFGLYASFNYVWPEWFRNHVDFTQLRPMHVSSVLFWILLAATASVLYALEPRPAYNKLLKHTGWIQLALWVVCILGIAWAYITKQFGGREYWEFPPFISLFLAFAWIVMLYVFFSIALSRKKWPVYYWMWMTGLVFFLFIFTENYFWLLPSFRSDFIKDTMVQWKVNGSIVGSWNQLVYGISFYLMEKISGDKSYARSPLAFAMYFLGLFNLMFNWSHHIYTLPTEAFVRYIGYGVSMTEWIILIRIFYTFNSNLQEAQKHMHLIAYRFLFAADIWVIVNLVLSLFMSVPGINLYTHGTHITVAHAMGTTIGINTMILLSAAWYFSGEIHRPFTGADKWMYRLMQYSLAVFWLMLVISGVFKGVWQMQDNHTGFREMMQSLKPWFLGFIFSGMLLATALIYHAIRLIRLYLKKI